MKTLKWIAAIVVGLIALILLVAAFLPKDRTFSQSIVIEKSPRLIFAQLNSMKNWENWSPFQEADPEMTSEYSGPDFGVGSRQDWKSKVNGDGNMLITESIKNQKVLYQLDLGMGTTYPTWFDLERNPEGVIVTWSVSMTDLRYPMGRLMMAIFSGQMNKMFLKGLENLKVYLNNQPADCILGEVTVIEVPQRLGIAISKTVSNEGVEEFLKMAFTSLLDFVGKNKMPVMGVPMAIYQGDENSTEWGVTALVPVKSFPAKLPDNFNKLELPLTKAVCIEHSGPYSTAEDSYYKILDYIMGNGMEIIGDSWEEYITDPEETVDPMKLKTLICFPVK